MDKVSREEVFNLTNLPNIEQMLREKRLRWFGHLMRHEGELESPARKTMLRYLTDESKWGKQLLNDFKIKKIASVDMAMIKVKDRCLWRSLSYAGTPLQGVGRRRRR